MNERMIELYKQAQEFAYKNISEEYWNTDNFHAIVSGKFAELIVRDVLDEVLQAMDDGMDVYDTVADKFGVEE